MKFTKQQAKAIYTSGKNLLISAGAGSGKTAVLSERVVEKIRQGIEVDRLVVLTFTNAAAKEMKLRIRKKLVEADASAYKKAIENLDAAHIRTFDSYALYLLKTYGYVYNVSSRVAIGETAAVEIEKQRIFDAILDRYYASGDAAFEAFIDAFEVKDDKRVKTFLLSFYDQLSFYTDMNLALKRFGEASFNEERFVQTFEDYTMLLKEMIVNVKDSIDDILSNCMFDASVEFVDRLKVFFTPLFEAESYQAMTEAASRLDKIPDLRSVAPKLKKEGGEAEGEYLKEARKNLKSMFDAFTERVAYSEAEHRSHFYKSGEHVAIICALLAEFDERFMRYQIDHEVMTFAAVARLTIRLLEEYPEICERLKRDIHEIMVDEYQDTNKLQERFIELIASDNVFQVGDVKQSIYRFRHAEPKLFTDKLYKYQTTGEGEAIALNANFRSRREVLEDLNKLFYGVMDAQVGGVDYTDDQALKYGNTLYDEHLDASVRYGLTLALYGDDDVSEYVERKQLSLEEMEMFFIAKDIESKVGHVKVFDHDAKKLRVARYEDFAILVGVGTQFDKFKKVFELSKVPLNVMRSAPFLASIDIDFYRNILKLIYAFSDSDYYRQHLKHSFLSVARSFVFDFSDDVVFDQLLKLPSRLGVNAGDILSDFEPLFKVVVELANTHEVMTIDEIFQTVLQSFDVAGMLTKLDDTFDAKQRMMYLEMIIKRLSETGYTLKDLVLYFDALVDADMEVDFDTSRLDSDDGVLLMTIHKSKGLEFPFVYVPSLKRRFNRADEHIAVFDHRYGFLLPVAEQGLRKSYLFDLYKERQLAEDVSERLRVLYVALTRAKEACIMPLFEGDETRFHKAENGVVKALERRRYYNAYSRVLHSMLDDFSEQIVRIQLSDYGLDPSYRDYQASYSEVEGEAISKEYQPPLAYEKAVSRKFSHDIESLLSASTLDAIAEGNRLHELLEHIDFMKPYMPQVEVLTDEVKTRELLVAFFESSLMQSLDIHAVYKEFPFLIEDAGDVTRGYIDLLVETKTSFVIIDYKLKAIDKGGYYAQIEGYRSVLSKMTSKGIEGYLYSIVDKRFIKVL